MIAVTQAVQPPMRVVHLEMEVGETLTFTGADGASVKVTVRQKGGHRVRLQVHAPDSVRLQRPQKLAPIG